MARLEPEVKRDHHRRLALVLEASGSADPEVLGVHFLEGGQPDRATDHFVRAADQAAEALAFDRRPACITARDLQPAEVAASDIYWLNSRMGDALANAGRGAEAAAAYLAAVHDAPVVRRDRTSAPRRHAVPDQRAHRRGASDTADSP